MTHRPLSEISRVAARCYTEAIVAMRQRDGDISADPDSGNLERQALWKRLRQSFDDMRGDRSRSENGDFQQAMRHLQDTGSLAAPSAPPRLDSELRRHQTDAYR